MAQKYRYTDEELGGICHNEISRAYGAESDEVQRHRRMALDYYYNRPRGDEKTGESQAQSSDVADMVNAVLAQLTPMVSNDALVAFEATDETDEDAARGETDAINDLIMDKNSGFVELQQCLKDAALCRNSFAKVWVEDTETAETRLLPEVGKADINRIVRLLNEPEGQEAELLEHDKDSGEATIKVVNSKRVFRWRSVDPINFLYASNWEYTDLQEIRFCAERDLPTRSQLISEDFDEALVNELPPVSTETRHEAHARNRRESMPNYDPQTADQQRVERHDCYLKIDMDGDGISEQWRVVIGNKKVVLHKEQVGWIPYASGSLFIAPHRLEGEDLFDRLKQTQDIKTAAYRRWLDGLYNAVWPRLGAQENVVDPGIDDARSGATVWTKGPPSQALMAIPVSDIGPSCQALLQYEDTRRSERGGAALDMQSADAQLVGETYSGIEKQYSVKEQLTQMMAKNVAETLIRSIYLLMHRTVRTFSRQPIKIKLRGAWQEVDARGWPARASVNVVPGLTPSARTATEQALQQIIQLGIMALERGLEGQIASLDGMYRAVIDLGRSKGLANPDQYLVDPSSQEAQQARQQAAQQAAQQAQQQQQIMQLQVQLAQAQLQIEQEKTRQKTFVDIYKADLDAEIKEAELIAEGRQRELDAQQRARESATETAGTAAANGGGG